MNGMSYGLAVFSAVSYGAADFLGGLATKRFAAYSVLVLSQLTGLVLVLLALPFLPSATPTPSDFLWGAAGGLFGCIGVALLYRGLAIGVMSVVAPVTAVCAVVIPLALLAIVLVSQTGLDEEGKRPTTGLSIAVLSGIGIGVFLVCLQRTGPSAGLWPLVAARAVSVTFFSIVAVAL